MAATCQYHEQGQRVHDVPATHVVLRRHRDGVWNVFQADASGSVAEFCLRHAGDVATQRNTLRKEVL